MKKECPYCYATNSKSEKHVSIIRIGSFRRKSDHKRVQRYSCKQCARGFSSATTHAYYRHNKRQLNYPIMELFCSGVSQRRIAKLQHVNLKTVARKLKVLGMLSLETLDISNQKFPPSEDIQFDDMETFEHTKCKPLSITLATENKTRRILGFDVSRMNAKGLLKEKALKKYGKRKDERNRNRKRLFEKLKPLVSNNAVIHSDESPHYVNDVRTFFPHARHERFKGQRGAVTGQGELKKVGFDPLFSINHTCAMLRANINRLFRKTWCTTKKPDRLKYHIAIYAVYHNFQLIESG